jgi:serine protease Do
MEKENKNLFITIITISIITSTVFGSVLGFWGGLVASGNTNLAVWYDNFRNRDNEMTEKQTENNTQVLQIQEESAVIDAVEKVKPAVVSIIVTKDLPVIERYYRRSPGNDFFNDFFGGGFDDFFNFSVPEYRQNGTEEREVGGGSGFLINSDGHIITNKHVVIDEEADYTVLMNDESRHEATVLARDPINDIAILKIEKQDNKDFPYLEMGDSDTIKAGQSVIAIGNALAEFRNTVSTGVISGLSRSIVAGGAGFGSEELTGVIQTDASINPGNSGGPLLNLAGQVIGVNTAIAQGAQNIGFALPINDIKAVYESVKENGRIIRPWLGVRYLPIDEDIAKENNLDVDYGVLIVRGEQRTDLAVIPGSPADKANLRENDIILEIDGEKLDNDNPLNKVIANHQVGDKIKLKILSQGDEKEIEVVLEERE